MTNSGGTLVTDNKHLAILSNNYFSSVFNASSLPTTSTNTGDENSTNVNLEHALSNFGMTTSEVRKALQFLTTNRNPGPDKVHRMLLKETKSGILSPLTNVLIVFREPILPSHWEKATVTKIFKK